MLANFFFREHLLLPLLPQRLENEGEERERETAAGCRSLKHRSLSLSHTTPTNTLPNIQKEEEESDIFPSFLFLWTARNVWEDGELRTRMATATAVGAQELCASLLLRRGISINACSDY